MTTKLYRLMALAMASSFAVTGYSQRTLDDFADTNNPSVAFPGATTSTATGTIISTLGNILGGERDVVYTVTTVTPGNPILGGNQVDVWGGPPTPTNLSGATSTACTPYLMVTYDGVDNNASTLNLSPGLGGINMMGTGTFATTLYVDGIGPSRVATVTFRVYSDATHWSDGVYSISNTGPDFTVPISIPRASFVTGSGAAGPADFTSVRAVQLILQSDQNALDFIFYDGITVPSDIALTAHISSLSAKIVEKQLQVNFTTLGEQDNDYFEVAASRDGKNFTTIGKINSKADNGNATAALHYDFTATVPATMVLGLGILLLGGSCVMSSRRHRMILSAITAVTFATILISCSKQSDIISGNTDLYIRIAQVDKDGTKTYSKIIKTGKE